MRRDRELDRALDDVSVPGEPEAEERAWSVIRAAYAERAPARRAGRLAGTAVAVAAGAVALAIGLSPAGAKVGDLVSDMVGIGEPNARPALRSLPAAGELLVESEQGPWIVGADGSKRLLGDYGEASWSPNGLFVVVAQGRELVAAEPDGDVRWTYAAPGEVSDPRWAGTSVDTRIAYRSGDDLRVIAGDGGGDSDHLIARHVAPVPPAWRPVGASKIVPGVDVRPFLLTYVDGQGAVHTVDADSGEAVAVSRDDRRRLTRPPSAPGLERSISPDGRRLATVEHVGARDRVIVARIGRHGGETLFSARGRLTGPTWSPDGRWLLVGWPAADQWLFIDADHPRRVIAINHVSEQFDPGGAGEGRFPRIGGWILPQR